MSLPLFERAAEYRAKTAIVAPEGVFTFGDLLDASARVATRLLAGRDDLDSERICFLVSPGWHYVSVQWGVW
ncbi:MAG: long-chain fatty acid--CoA ligase, partial [Gemmatimonadota bacterium]|nr:long-chain fatty acid--CoA ligase [Gemmatimonadota bacterium]